MTDRGQANLVGFAAAVIVVTTVTVAGVALANDALADADREPGATHAAAELAAHFVDGDAPHARAPSVVGYAAVSALNASDLDAAVPPIRGRPIRVSLGGEVLVDREMPGGSDDASEGGGSETARGVRRSETVRIERRVRVERDVPRTASVDLAERRRVELDDHVGRVAVTVEAAGEAVTTVRAGGQVVLHDPSGLNGRYAFDPPRTRPLVVEFESGASSTGLRRRGSGTATVDWTAANASVERLVVVVGV